MTFSALNDLNTAAHAAAKAARKARHPQAQQLAAIALLTDAIVGAEATTITVTPHVWPDMAQIEGIQ